MRQGLPAAAVFRVRCLLVGAMTVLGYGQPGGASAAETPPPLTYVIEQPAQPVAEALRSIARQTGASVLFDPGVVNGRMSRAVSGRMSAAEAISRALGGSGLTADVMKDGAIVVKPVPPPAPVGVGASAPAGARSMPGGVPPTGSAGQVPARLAQGSSSSVPSRDRPPPAVAGTHQPDLQKIEVTGSRLRRIAAEGPAPVNTYGREEIEKSGQPTLERFLSSLSEVSVGAGEGSFGATGGQGTVQLRGLPLGSTLTLINGRRVQAVGSSSGNYFNLNLIPLSAVERVEVLPVGSSAVYGGDALAGVVNVILRKATDGLALDAQLGSTKGSGDGSLSLATGGTGESGSFLLLGSYARRSPLTMAERAFFRDADYRRYGGTDQRTRTCAPGTVSSASGANLPGLSSSFAAIPVGPAGRSPTAADFVATSGVANLCSGQTTGNGYSLIHGSETLGMHASGERQLAGSWSVFGELTRTEDRLWADEAAFALNNVLVPASNAYNPFGVDVRVTGVLGAENGLQAFERRTTFTRAVMGARGDLGGGWDFEVTGSTSRDSGESRTSGVNANAAARAAALASASADAALNPFTTGRAASDQVLRAVWPESLRINHGKRDQLAAFARGTLLSLPAGPLEAIAGVEVGRDSFESSIPGTLSIAADRAQRAAYAELRAPLLRSTPQTGAAWDLAALTVAARRDRYSDFGSAGTYQAGLEIRPARTLLLRASGATSFKPPTLVQTNVPDQRFPTEAFGLVDPARGGQPVVGGEVIRATNPGLGPERGRAYALGAVWEPDGSLGTRMGVTAWRVRIKDLIGLAYPQALVNNEGLFPGVVTRGPSAGSGPGAITRVLWGEVNYGEVDTGGVDLEASHAWKGVGGTWTLAAGATRTREYRVVLSPSAPAEDRLGRRFYDFWSPAWKGRLAAGFKQGSWGLSVTSRYVGAYKDMGTSTRGLGNAWTHDLSASLDLLRLGLVSNSSVKGATVSLGIVNVTDRQPEFVETSPFYDPTQSDWRGRYASARLSLTW